MKGKNLWRLVYLTIPLTAAVFAAVLLANEWKNARPAQSVDRVPEAVRYAAEAEAVEEESAEYQLDSYTEGDGPAPEWYRPDEPMAAVWIADVTDINVGDKSAKDTDVPCNARQSDLNPIQRTDAGCPDWNVDTTVYGWDGHSMEAWEMDLFARVFYLEFWQPDMMLCEAGCDAILRLWESGEKGRTLGEVLSSRNEDGSWTYSTYPDVWETVYDADGLAWCREYTAERFAEGPEWIAPYFRLDYYHEWAVPAYQIGNVYFSVAK